MKKADLVDSVAKQHGIARPQVETIVDAALEAVAVAMEQGERIDFRGFGAFLIKDSKARTARNPRTGEPIAIEAKRVPTFRPGKELKERMNKAKS
jgi:integration host factor beta subunit